MRFLPSTSSAALAAAGLFAVQASGANPSAYEPGVDPGMGFNLVSWWNFGGNGANVWETAVQQVHDAGFDEVSLSPVRYFNQTTGTIATTSQRGAELSHVAAGVARAKSLGMKVTVNPFVEPENFATWRGFWNPTPGTSTSNTFWSDYEQYIADVAAMAQTSGADALTVGTELRALVQNSGNNSNWSSVISAADAAFTGDLGYASNWDNYANGNLASAIWDNPAIDFLGIDAYFPVASNFSANNSGTYPNESFIGLVEDDWNELLDDEIIPFAQARQSGGGLPIVFTEYGLLPFNRAVRQHNNVDNGNVDTDEQIMGFEALLRALDGRAADGTFEAMHIWQWGMSGSDGSQWNMDASLPANQPDNVPATQWLSDFVSNPLVVVLAGDYNGSGLVEQGDLDLVLQNWGLDTGVGGIPAGWLNDLPSGLIEQEELDGVLSNWGATASPDFGGVVVPEPTMAWLVAAGVYAGLPRRLRRVQRHRRHAPLRDPKRDVRQGGRVRPGPLNA